VTLYLIRHAHAGSRSSWNADDMDRPLSPQGCDQAQHLVRLLNGAKVVAVRSSPAVRCVQTVAPIAAAHGLDVDHDPLLTEGHDAGRAISALLDATTAAGEGDVVACSHGDMIPRAMGLLVSDGLSIDGPEGPSMSKKGSMWAIEVVDGRAVSARHHHPG
jgi:phosphohistidine phosphatase SixA